MKSNENDHYDETLFYQKNTNIQKIPQKKWYIEIINFSHSIYHLYNIKTIIYIFQVTFSVLPPYQHLQNVNFPVLLNLF